MNQIEKSNKKLAKALANKLDALSIQCHEIAKRIGLDVERAYRIGEWDRIKKFDRLEDGEDFLSDADCNLLVEEDKFCIRGEYNFDTEINTEIDAAQLKQFREWHAASYRERAVALGMFAPLRVSIGASEEEFVSLVCLVSELLVWIHMPDDVQIEAEASQRISLEMSKSGKKGAAKRHAPMGNLKNWSVERYRLSEWKSVPEAAYTLKEEIIAYGRTIGAHLTEQNAQRTIEKWFRQSA
ncbi:hypothetical protein PO883_05125 [Massilia sp. DJPM01]|uniref:hypothetical protein n=1 Tax=Massilia sp. DJPM01 TaxID=3024404 RepID=UPI00259E43AA|nr:hypothetical protein [Massilia sp. DJPM01]MDM5176577.1 hypothetical protein [Massilia sp. DJPM01]